MRRRKTSTRIESSVSSCDLDVDGGKLVEYRVMVMDGRAELPLTTSGPFTDSSNIDWDAINAILSPVHQRLASD